MHCARFTWLNYFEWWISLICTITYMNETLSHIIVSSKPEQGANTKLSNMIFGDFLETVRGYRREDYWNEFERLNGQVQLARHLSFLSSGEVYSDHFLVQNRFLPPGNIKNFSKGNLI